MDAADYGGASDHAGYTGVQFGPRPPDAPASLLVSLTVVPVLSYCSAD